MPYYKFGPNDIFHNRIKAHPYCEFTIYSGSIYYNNMPYVSASIHSGNVGHVPVGHVNLYEMNLDRDHSLHTFNAELDTGTKVMIYPWITKAGGVQAFKSISTSSLNQAAYGTVLTESFSYPLSASIVRQYYYAAHPDEFNHAISNLGAIADNRFTLKDVSVELFPGQPENFTTNNVTVSSSQLDALRNTLDYYTHVSPHYEYSSSNEQGVVSISHNKSMQELCMLNIPSIFYGSSIKKGSVRLQYFITGSLISEVNDKNENGELIETSGSYKDASSTVVSGNVAGVVLYKEGIILLTGSWDLSSGNHKEAYLSGADGVVREDSPKWTHFGAGANDATGSTAANFHLPSSSYVLAFEGTNYIPTTTMMAHAPRAFLNHSNNPTYIKPTSWDPAPGGDNNATAGPVSYKSGSVISTYSGSSEYVQDHEIEISNVVSGAYANQTGSFEKHTYISKIGIYDKSKRLIGIAKLATPVKKTEARDLTFKLKIDY